MKKRSLKCLKLNKKSISKINKLEGEFNIQNPNLIYGGILYTGAILVCDDVVG